jgi:hypothetical protein
LKLVQERAGNTLEAIGIDKDFLGRIQELREVINKWDYMKLKSFCTTKVQNSKLKWPSTEWEKIFASYSRQETDKHSTLGSQKTTPQKSMIQ